MKVFSPYIIPFYIPNRGCPNRCLYCNSFITTHGEHHEIDRDYFDKRVESFLKTRRGRGTHVEVAFYGGSFNTLTDGEREYYLELVAPFLGCSRVDALRLSLRPDCLTKRFLGRLAGYRTVSELGIQSMHDATLKKIERGHTSADVKKAISLLKSFDVKVCAHLMVGLPGEDERMFFDSLRKVVSLKPDFLRIHPTLVLKDTGLARIYNRGKYSPLSLEDAVRICALACSQAEGAGIKVLRLGLQANESLVSRGGLIAGPYHESFGEMVRSHIAYERLIRLFENERNAGLNKGAVKISVNSVFLSKVLGQKRENIKKLKRRFGLNRVSVAGDQRLGKEEIILEAFSS